MMIQDHLRVHPTFQHSSRVLKPSITHCLFVLQLLLLVFSSITQSIQPGQQQQKKAFSISFRPPNYLPQLFVSFYIKMWVLLRQHVYSLIVSWLDRVLQNSEEHSRSQVKLLSWTALSSRDPLSSCWVSVSGCQDLSICWCRDSSLPTLPSELWWMATTPQEDSSEFTGTAIYALRRRNRVILAIYCWSLARIWAMLNCLCTTKRSKPCSKDKTRQQGNHLTSWRFLSTQIYSLILFRTNG